MTIITANELAYQSIYIDAKASNWQEVIVFHDPIFDDEIPGVITLKSLRLENCIGFVLAAPKNRIRYFREKAKDLDTEKELGKKQPRDILKILLALSEEIGGTVIYIQDEKIGTPKEDISCKEPAPQKKKKKPKKQKINKPKKEADSFFDPITKRMLVLKGPQYFDPSLPTEEKEMKEIKKREEKLLTTSSQLKQSPTVGVYPENINPTNKSLWDSVITGEVFESEDNRIRWSYAKQSYEKLCDQLELTAYKLRDLNTKADILKDIKKSISFAIGTLNQIGDILAKPMLHNVEKLGDDFYIMAVTWFKVPHNDSEGIFDRVSNKLGFKYAITSQHKNLIKKLDDRTNITIHTEDNEKITAFINYKLSKNDGAKLVDFDNINNEQMRFKLINLHRRYL